jgi:transposase-like protein
MITTKVCPHCGETTNCLEYESENEFIDDHLSVSTEYVCLKCHCIFTETMHYSVHYEDTEITIDDEGEI